MTDSRTSGDTNLVAAVEEMPADKFGYKPTPQQMSFANLVLHMTESNNYLCAKAGDIPRSWESSWRLGSRRRFRDMAVPAGLPILYYSVLPGKRCALDRRFPRPADFSEVPLWSVSGWPKITGQFNESLSAKPPPDLFWRVRICISLPVGFSTSGREVPVPGQSGREAVFEASRTRTAESFGCRTRC
jgi:hypothetical protein